MTRKVASENRLVKRKSEGTETQEQERDMTGDETTFEERATLEPSKCME